MKGFDVLSNPSSRVTKSTVLGGLLSVAAVVLCIALFYNEYASF